MLKRGFTGTVRGRGPSETMFFFLSLYMCVPSHGSRGGDLSNFVDFGVGDTTDHTE